jgi:predicted metalloenzyme YecM
MKVGITIDGVIRDFITKFESVYDKYYPVDIDESEEETEELPERDIKTLDLLDYFEFSGGTKELNEFMYVDAALEIFGHAGEVKLNSVEHLNQLHNIIEDLGHTPIVISKELNNSKPATLFFLSKLSSKINNIIFVRDYDKKWDHVDILITANPETLKSKTSGKISIKVINEYNKNIDSDYTLVDLKELLDDRNTLEKILSTETVEFEDIN